MKRSNAWVRFFLMMVLAAKVSAVPAQELQIWVTGIRSVKGKLIFNIFRDSESYLRERPYSTFTIDKKGVASGTLSTGYKLQPGIYGIVLVDDENGSGKIDKNMVGIPKEGFGFSNFFMEQLKKPAFNDFKFNLKTGNNNVAIRVKYL